MPSVPSDPGPKILALEHYLCFDTLQIDILQPVSVRGVNFNPLKPNGPYMCRNAQLTSKRCILYIYSTNIGTEYFKRGIYSPLFFLFKMQFVS